MELPVMMRRTVLRPLWVRLLLVLDGFVRFVPCRTRPDRVLVLRTDALGDFVLWLDAAKEVRALYPEPAHRLTLVVDGRWRELAEALPWWDEVWGVDFFRFFWNPLYRLRFLIKLRRAGFAVALRPQLTHDLYFGDSMIRGTGAAERIGAEGDSGILSAAEYRRALGWYTRIIPDDSRRRFELDRTAAFVRALGRPAFVASVPQLPRFDDRRRADLPPDYFVVAAGAEDPGRRWPEDRFRALAQRIHAATGWTAAICGSASEKDILKWEDGDNVPVIDLTGRTDLKELIATIAGARLVIGNETGPIHIAAAVATPALCVMGGGHFGRFLPYADAALATAPTIAASHVAMECFGCGWRCVYPRRHSEPYPCVDAVTLSQARRELTPVLSEISG